ncbi:MAG: hypothetical protein L0219_02755 [Phycisphaerales bacterium]|nr:hypothetical protein [Phycisphaerales bacterium]MCI0676096.1 hypothetical protein [Phycisphaerales bacterium]
MALKSLRSLIASGLAVNLAAASHAQPTIQVTYNFCDPFLQANNLISATNPTLNGLTGGAARWDSGLPGNPATFGNPADGDPAETAGGFALFTDGSSDLSIQSMVWISTQPNGVPVNSSTQWPVMRLTWPDTSANMVSFALAMNTPAVEVPLTVVVPSFTMFGACCSGSACTDTTEVLCLFEGGVFQGGCTECSSVSCPQPCPADLTNDGQVDVADLLDLVEAWGAAGGPADLNGDGIVNVADLLELISAWGECP